MHTDPDYSAAYVVLRTDSDDGIEGHGLTFTSGRGTEVCVAAIRALEPFVVGRSLDGIVADMSGLLAKPRLGQPAALARAREGRAPSRHGGGRQRGLGSLGQDRGKAAVEAARRSLAGGDRRVCRLPLHHRRARARRRRSSSSRMPAAGAAPGRRRSSRPGTRRTRRRPAGSATTTPRSRRSSGRRSRRGSRT